jgi:3',5'-cyclic AMP phosphodiesterase CpdA
MRTRTAAILLAVCLSFAGSCRTAWPEGATEMIGGLDSNAARAGAAFPNVEGSLRFMSLGDFGTGSSAQYRLAARMAEAHRTFPFEIAVLVGDNLYGSERPQDFKTKFEDPYKPLLDAGVRFYASLGNHDGREQRFYKLFNMEGRLYYSFKAPRQDVRFFALESTYLEPEQLKWLENELRTSSEEWKIVFFHHALYSSGGRHGSDEVLREMLEPLFIAHNVSVVFAGHDHHYERTKPQNGIVHFVTGSGGQLRRDYFTPNLPFSEKIVADQLVFFLAEIVDDTMTFKAIGIDGRVVDEGTVTRRGAAPAGTGS